VNLLTDVVTYVRRIIKSPSNSSITDNLILDYINRFVISDMDARVQLFDYKTTYQFQTQPGVDQYNMPLYSLQTEQGNQSISYYPVYQGFTGNARIGGVPVYFTTQKEVFNPAWSTYIQPVIGNVVGDNTVGPYTINIPFSTNTTTTVNQQPSTILRGHVDISGVIATGANVDPPVTSTFITTIPVANTFPSVWITSTDATGANVVVADSGQFLSSNVNYGLLMSPGKAPLGNAGLSGGYSTTSNTINYQTGVIKVTFPVAIPSGQNINVQAWYYNPGLPRAILYYNNTLTLRSIPAMQYLVEIDAYLTPAAYLTTSAALQFGYMAEYIARGAARKILSDTGDIEQFQFYEPLFREQETLVWKRSQRQFTSTRTQTIYSQGSNQFGMGGNSGYGAI